MCNKKNYFLALFLFVFIFSIFTASFSNKIVYAADEELANSGFIPGNIWYSKYPLVEGDTVKIFTLLLNNSQNPISGTVEFYDKNVFLGKKDFSISTSGTKEVSVDWRVTFGDHLISAKIVDSKISLGNNKTESAVFQNNDTGEDKKFVPKKVEIIPSEQNTTSEQTNGDAVTSVENKLSGVGDLIKDKTPSVVYEPVAGALGTVDGWRQNELDVINNNKQKTSEEIKLMSEVAANNPDQAETNKALKPFKYVWLFILKLGSFIFAHKIIFYLLIVVILVLIGRLIWVKMIRR